MTESKSADSLAERVRVFVRDEILPFERDPRSKGQHGPSEELVRELQSLGRKAGLFVPHLGKEWGGQGLDKRAMAPVFRAAGYSLLGPLALNIQAPDEGNMHLLEVAGTAPQRQRFLKPLASGEVRSTFLMTEPDGGAGSDPSMLQTKARLIDGIWQINGRKTFATGAAGADFAIAMALTEAGATMFLLPMNAPGVRIERILDTIDGAMPGGHAVVVLENVMVDGGQVLGEVGKGFAYAQMRLAPARLTHCMRWLGAASRAHEIASVYACKRLAFGKPLIDHEGVGFMLADNMIDLRQSELIIDWCAGLLDSGNSGGAESSMTKVAVSEALFRVADRCVQILGGTGVTSDTIVEQVFRELRAFRIYDGPSEVHRWSLAKRIKRRVHAGDQA